METLANERGPVTRVRIARSPWPSQHTSLNVAQHCVRSISRLGFQGEARARIRARMLPIVDAAKGPRFRIYCEERKVTGHSTRVKSRTAKRLVSTDRAEVPERYPDGPRSNTANETSDLEWQLTPQRVLRRPSRLTKEALGITEFVLSPETSLTRRSVCAGSMPSAPLPAAVLAPDPNGHSCGTPIVLTDITLPGQDGVWFVATNVGPSRYGARLRRQAPERAGRGVELFISVRTRYEMPPGKANLMRDRAEWEIIAC